MPVSFVFAYARPVAQHYRQESMKSISSFHYVYGNTENSLLTAHTPQNRLVTVKR